MFDVGEFVGILEHFQEAGPVFDVAREVADPGIEDVLETVFPQEAVRQDPQWFREGVVNAVPEIP